MSEKRGITSSAFLATAPLAAMLVGAALAQPGLSDAVRIALVAGIFVNVYGLVAIWGLGFVAY